MIERRTSQVEIRIEGRRLSGTVMRYGDVSPSHRERFEPGSLRLAESVHLDLFHDPERAVAWHPGGGLALDNGPSALAMRAELPPIPAAERALAEVRAGKATGLSVEFNAVRETREGELRVIHDAVLSGVGIVAKPSYGESHVEARAKAGTVKARIPYGKRLECRCHRSSGDCNAVAFERGAFAEAVADDKLIAFSKDYAAPLASAGRRKTLRLREPDEGLEVEMDLPDTQAARDMIAASENVPLIVRPLYDQDASDFDEAAGLATYRQLAGAGLADRGDRRERRMAGGGRGRDREGEAEAPRMAVTINPTELAAAVDGGVDTTTATRLLSVARALVDRYAFEAPEPIANEAAIRVVGYLLDQPAAALRTQTVGPLTVEIETARQSVLRHSGAMAMLSPWKIRRGGAIG